MKKPSESSHTFTREQSEALRIHARDALKTWTEAAIGLAKALFEIYWGRLPDGATPLVEAWGFPDFDTYAERELKIHGGTARSHVRVYDELCVKRQFADGELPPSITALRELAKVSKRITDRRELAQWIKRANELTACELQAEVDKEIHGRHRVKHLGFHMNWAAGQRVMKRIREAREELGLKTNGEALERMLNEWAGGKPTPREIRLRRAG